MEYDQVESCPYCELSLSADAGLGVLIIQNQSHRATLHSTCAAAYCAAEIQAGRSPLDVFIVPLENQPYSIFDANDEPRTVTFTQHWLDKQPDDKFRRVAQAITRGHIRLETLRFTQVILQLVETARYRHMMQKHLLEASDPQELRDLLSEILAGDAEQAQTSFYQMVVRQLRVLVDYHRLYDQLVLDNLIPPSRQSAAQLSTSELLSR